MALTGANSVSVNRSPGQTTQQYAEPLALQQYAGVPSSEQVCFLMYVLWLMKRERVKRRGILLQQ